MAVVDTSTAGRVCDCQMILVANADIERGDEITAQSPSPCSRMNSRSRWACTLLSVVPNALEYGVKELP